MSAIRPERPPTLRQSLESVRAALRERGVPEWRIEAEILLRRVAEVGRAEFLSLVYSADARLTYAQAERLNALIARRLDGEPLAYIVGRREFYGLDLEVNESVLIPRQETELLVELALDYLADKNRANARRPPTIVDIGTGSGAVALAIAAHTENASIIGVDISPPALDVAIGNRDRLPLRSHAEFILGDTLTPIASLRADLIISNPPYIPTGALRTLAPEVRREPKIALDGGADGLDHFRRLTAQAGKTLAPRGAMIVELMPEQMDAATKIARRNIPDIASVSSRPDLMGNSRALVIETGAPRGRA